MPSSGEKPYRVYRQPKRPQGDGSIRWSGNGSDGGGSGPKHSGPRRGRWTGKALRRLALVVLVAGCVWFLVAFISFRSAVKEANERLPAQAERALSATTGPALVSGRNILLLGADSREGQADAGRADTIMVVRADLVRRRFSMLSIPRDLQTEIPGYGSEKINAAYALGGPALTVKSIKSLTGLPIHHVMQVDFSGFRTLIDDIGGITVTSPREIVSSKFDGYQWRFGKGELHLNGKRALAYARVRKNLKNPNESDLSRAMRQQQVLDAISNKIASTNTLMHPISVPAATVEPLATDASASQLVIFALAKTLASDSSSLRCRLGGSLGYENGQSVIVGDEDNRAVVRMFLGKQDPLPPDVSANAFAPGCTTREE